MGIEKVERSLEHEDAISRWLEKHSTSLREIMDQYRAYVSIELTKAQAQIGRLTHERDVVVKEVLKLRRIVAQIKETIKGD